MLLWQKWSVWFSVHWLKTTVVRPNKGHFGDYILSSLKNYYSWLYHKKNQIILQCLKNHSSSLIFTMVLNEKISFINLLFWMIIVNEIILVIFKHSVFFTKADRDIFALLLFFLRPPSKLGLMFKMSKNSPSVTKSWHLEKCRQLATRKCYCYKTWCLLCSLNVRKGRVDDDFIMGEMASELFKKTRFGHLSFFYEFRKCLKADAHFLSPLNSELGLWIGALRFHVIRGGLSDVSCKD